MSVYAKNVLGRTVVRTDIPTYADTRWVEGDLAEYIVLSYQLGLMGIDTQGALKTFNPHGIVTRAEFATVLSRALFGNKYNQDGE